MGSKVSSAAARFLKVEKIQLKKLLLLFKKKLELEQFAEILPALVTVSSVDGPADVVPVDFGCDQFLLGDGNSGNDDDGEGDGVDCGVNGVHQSEGQEAGKSGECTELHDGGWES